MVTGATGLLGANAALALAPKARVVGVARHVPTEAPVEIVGVDLSRSSDREGLIARIHPDVVFHAAANASHESCEAQPAAAEELNVAASRDLAEQANAIGAKFVYISTDAVFDGVIGGYGESDLPSPTSVYGRTKRDGELAVLEAAPTALVARVNFFGWSPSGSRSLAEFFVNRLSEGKPAPGFTDVRVSTMYVETLVDRIRRLVDVDATGIYHVANDESTTKFEFGRRIARALGVDEELVPPTQSSDVLSVKRGADLSLNTQKLREEFNLPTTQQNGVDALFQARATGRRDALRAFRSNTVSGE